MIGLRSNQHIPLALQNRWYRAACWTWSERAFACLLGERARIPAANADFGTRFQVRVLACRILAGRAVVPTKDEETIVLVGSANGSSWLKEQAQMRVVPGASARARQQRAKDLTGWYLYPLATFDCAVPELQVQNAGGIGACSWGIEALFEVPYQRSCIEDFQEFRWRTECECVAIRHQRDRLLAESDCRVVAQPVVISKHPAAPGEIGIVGTSGRASCPWQQSSRPH